MNVPPCIPTRPNKSKGRQTLHHKSSLRKLGNKFDSCMVHIILVV